jgi:hypothetical protein
MRAFGRLEGLRRPHKSEAEAGSRWESAGVGTRCPGVDRRMMRLTGFLAALVLIGAGGCSASGPDPAFETAYSAVGVQVK